MDRLSPLTNTITVVHPVELSADIEKFQLDADASMQPTPTNSVDINSHLSAANGNIRRHTVGPGDALHEQALGNNAATAMNFKFKFVGDNFAGQNIPINLPMMENQPLHAFTIKDQHLLKPPTVMGASKFHFTFLRLKTNHLLFFLQAPLVVEPRMVAQTFKSITPPLVQTKMITITDRTLRIAE